MKKRDLLTGYFFVIVSAVIYGCMPLMATHIYADGVNPMTLVFLRNFLALPVLAVLAIFQQKTLKIPLATLVDMIMNGEIKDAKTQTAILKLKLLKDSGKI